MNKQPEITATTRNTFLEAFCALYQTKPIEKITVMELTQKAGYSRATFYNYFKDVYDLLECVENEFIASLMDTIRENIKRRQSLEYFVQDFVQIIQSKDMYIQVFMNSSNSAAFVGKLRETALPLLLSAFGSHGDNLSARYALEFYLSGLIPVIGSWIRNGQDLSTESLALLVKGILQDGVLAQLT